MLKLKRFVFYLVYVWCLEFYKDGYFYYYFFVWSWKKELNLNFRNLKKEIRVIWLKVIDDDLNVIRMYSCCIVKV